MIGSVVALLIFLSLMVFVFYVFTKSISLAGIRRSDSGNSLFAGWRKLHKFKRSMWFGRCQKCGAPKCDHWRSS